jgi:hypothetical protein
MERRLISERTRTALEGDRGIRATWTRPAPSDAGLRSARPTGSPPNVLNGRGDRTRRQVACLDGQEPAGAVNAACWITLGQLGDAFAEIAAAVIDQLRTPEVVVRTSKEACRHDNSITENRDELFPAEQARLIQLLIKRRDIAPVGPTIRLRA